MQRAGDGGIEDPGTDRVGLILSELDDADFDRVDPPAEIWERIEASIRMGGTASPKVAPREVVTGTVVEYWIDADDVVIDVGERWAEFARENGAPDLATRPSRRTLWSSFEGDEVRELWQLVVERARRLQARVEVPLRCDASDARRWFRMEITPEADGRVHFRCELVFEEARPPVALLDVHSERDVGLEPVALCSWCGQGRHGARWLDVEELVAAARLLERTAVPAISYGICGTCRDEMSAELLVAGAADETGA